MSFAALRADCRLPARLSATVVAAAEEQAIQASARRPRPRACRTPCGCCRDAVPNVRTCCCASGRTASKISNRCRTVLASYGLHRLTPSDLLDLANERRRPLERRRAPPRTPPRRARGRARGAVTRMNFAFRSSSPNGRAGSPGTCVTVRSCRLDRVVDRDMRRPGLRIAGGEQALLGPHLDARHEGRQRRRDRPGRRAQAIGQVRRKRRDRHLVLHAGQMREAVARGDAVVDHLQVRRQHRDADAHDRLSASTPSARISFSACVAAMVWRAAHQGLNEIWLSASPPSRRPAAPRSA